MWQQIPLIFKHHNHVKCIHSCLVFPTTAERWENSSTSTCLARVTDLFLQQTLLPAFLWVDLMLCMVPLGILRDLLSDISQPLVLSHIPLTYIFLMLRKAAAAEASATGIVVRFKAREAIKGFYSICFIYLSSPAISILWSWHTCSTDVRIFNNSKNYLAHFNHP